MVSAKHFAMKQETAKHLTPCLHTVPGALKVSCTRSFAPYRKPVRWVRKMLPWSLLPDGELQAQDKVAGTDSMGRGGDRCTEHLVKLLIQGFETMK